MGYGGIVRKFLELPIWRPLGRMSLSFYLVHAIYISVHIGRGRVPHNFDNATIVIIIGILKIFVINLLSVLAAHLCWGYHCVNFIGINPLFDFRRAILVGRKLHLQKNRGKES